MNAQPLNQNICDDILRYGNILEDKSFTMKNGDNVRQYIIECDSNIYHMTKINGEWAYMIMSQ